MYSLSEDWERRGEGKGRGGRQRAHEAGGWEPDRPLSAALELPSGLWLTPAGRSTLPHTPHHVKVKVRQSDSLQPHD